MWPLIVVDLIVGAVLRKLGRLGDGCWLVLAVLVTLGWIAAAALYLLTMWVVEHVLVARAWVRSRRAS